jgi:hypothetical protein
MGVTQALSVQSWPSAQVPHIAPPVPQAFTSFPAWHFPAASQQPAVHVSLQGRVQAGTSATTNPMKAPSSATRVSTRMYDSSSDERRP